MKFKKEFIVDDLGKAVQHYCISKKECFECELYHKYCNGNYETCMDYCENNLKEALQIIGYEVIEDEEQSVENDKKETYTDISKWTLEQAKEYCKNHVSNNIGCNDKCVLLNKNVCCGGFVRNWNIEEQTKQIKLTKEEIDICKVLGAKWVSRNVGTDIVKFWNGKPMKFENAFSYYEFGDIKNISFVYTDKMPSVKPGDCIYVGDLINGGNE